MVINSAQTTPTEPISRIKFVLLTVFVLHSQEDAEKQVKELQHQMSLLKSQLSHSEKTQKDFVELSQSLQVSYRKPLVLCHMMVVPEPLPPLLSTKAVL